MASKKSKVEKKIGIKAFTRKGKRVKAFRRLLSSTYSDAGFLNNGKQ